MGKERSEERKADAMHIFTSLYAARRKERRAREDREEREAGGHANIQGQRLPEGGKAQGTRAETISSDGSDVGASALSPYR